MSKNIEISTEVFAAIWRARKDGEESENDILARLFNCTTANSFQLLEVTPELGLKMNGYFDSRNNVHFKEGFVAFRQYKGTLYSAMATNGQWLRIDTSEHYISLNQLNESIASGKENIWNGNWHFVDDNGIRQSIDKLRQ